MENISGGCRMAICLQSVRSMVAVSILSDGMAFYLAAGGFFPIGQAFGSR
jgi:hypothetical protein